MTRRAFFAALASLPFVGRFFRDEDGAATSIYASSVESAYRTIAADGPRHWFMATDASGNPTRFNYVRDDGTAVTIAIPVRRL